MLNCNPTNAAESLNLNLNQSVRRLCVDTGTANGEFPWLMLIAKKRDNISREGKAETGN